MSMLEYVLYATRNYGEKVSVIIENCVADLSLLRLLDIKTTYLYSVVFHCTGLHSAIPQTMRLQGETYVRRFDRVYVAQAQTDVVYLRRVFDDLSSYYSGLAENELHQMIYAAMYRSIILKDSVTRILDYGCGSGLGALVLQRLLFPETVELYGCDLSPLMLNQIPPAVAAHYKTVSLTDGKTVPFQTGTFHYILLVFVAHLLENSTIDDLFRVLRPGGSILMNRYKFDVFKERYVYAMSHLSVRTMSLVDSNPSDVKQSQSLMITVITKR